MSRNGSTSAAVEQVAACVEHRYVDAAAGAQAAESLRDAERSGRYAGTAYGPGLARQLTYDLQEVLPDLHLQVRWSEAAREPAETSDWDDPDFLAVYWACEDLANQGISRVERLAGNVGLLVLHNVDEPEGTAAAVDAACAFLARCSALLLDLRDTSGGAPSGVAHLLGHLLPAGTPLIEVVDRSGAVVERTQVAADAPRTFGADVPVYVLVGPRTVSACEELAYDLAAAGRATLVGQTTIGAANPVDSYVVDPHLVVRVPTGVVRHAATGRNWGGTGIDPDLQCPVGEALTVGHRLAAAAVLEQVSAGRIPHGMVLVDELQAVLSA